MKILLDWLERAFAWCKGVHHHHSPEMFQSLFNEAKAAEVVAFLLDKADGSMEVLKLMKLVYLVERRSYEQFGEPIIGDVAYSFEHGPVLSRVFDLAKAESAVDSPKWSAYVAPSTDRHVILRNFRAFTADDLLSLSDADLEILNEVWDQFGHMSANELRTYTHKLPEYEEQAPGKRSLINQVKLLKAVGLSEKQAHKHISTLLGHNRARAAFKQSA